MSRVGKQPIAIPSGVTVTLNGRTVSVQGKGGTLSIEHRPEITVQVDNDAKEVVVTRDNDTRQSRAYHGLTRSLIQNMVTGVVEGYKKELEIVGVGWNAQVQGRKVNLNLGYADTRVVNIPEGVNVNVQGNKLEITGPDKQAVGQCAAEIRSHRKPEPYNGKGVKYAGEVITRKAGKAFAGGG